MSSSSKMNSRKELSDQENHESKATVHKAFTLSLKTHGKYRPLPLPTDEVVQSWCQRASWTLLLSHHSSSARKSACHPGLCRSHPRVNGSALSPVHKGTKRGGAGNRFAFPLLASVPCYLAGTMRTMPRLTLTGKL